MKIFRKKGVRELVSSRKGAAEVIALLVMLVALSAIAVVQKPSITGFYTLDGGGICTCSNCTDCTDSLNDANCNYVRLNQSINNHVGTCINDPVNASNKTFDCQNNLIDGDNLAVDYGIYFNSLQDNISIVNCSVKEFAQSIRLDGCYSIDVIGNSLSSSSDASIYINVGGGTLIRIFNNIISNNTYGIASAASGDVEVYNNIFNNSINILTPFFTTSSFWNTTKQLGTSIVGTPYIGGNYWAYPNSTGFSETCYDNDGDNICDQSYSIDLLEIDFLPLTFQGPNTTCYCYNCTDCTNALNDNNCSYVKLNQSIINEAATCIDNPAGFSNKTFDCQNYTIDGNGDFGLPDSGIYLFNKQYNIIKNCNISGFGFGISLSGSSYNILENNNIYDNFRGIFLFSSYLNNITYNDIYNNNNWGIEIYSGSYNNTIVGNILDNDSIGIDIHDNSNGNNIINNTIINHGVYGIRTRDFSFNKNISNNNLSYNNQTGISIASNSNSPIYLNYVCFNNQSLGAFYDIDDQDSSTGDDNTCDTTLNYNDTGTIGCTYACIAASSTICYCHNCSNCTASLNSSDCIEVRLNQSIITTSDCIYNPAGFNNKTFDCQNFSIEGDGGDGVDRGINLETWNINNTLKNCNISGFYQGIYLLNSRNITLLDNRIFSNNYSIVVIGSGVNIRSNRLFNNSYGISSPVFAQPSQVNVTNNFFNNTENIPYSFFNTETVWNTSKIVGNSIINTSFLGGNYWALLNGSGYSQTCYDNDGDNICDVPYTIIGSQIDYLPLTLQGPSDSFPTSILISPSNNTNTTNTTITFTCNATDDNNLVNLSIFIWNSTGNIYYNNYTNISGTSNQSSWNVTLPVDNYLWNCLAYDNASQSDWAENYTLNILEIATDYINSENSTESEWWMFHRFLNHTGYNNINTPSILDVNVSSFTTGGSVISSPIVANGIIYVGSNDNSVYAVNASNMQHIANFTAGNIVQSSPAYADGIVYIGSDDHKVYALNATNISQKLGEFTTGDKVLSSLSVYNGFVYVASNDCYLYALDAKNISHMLANQSIGGFWCGLRDYKGGPAVYNDKVYIFTYGAQILALNYSNISQIIDQGSASGQPFNSPLIYDDVVYIGSSGGNFFSYNASNASQKLGQFNSDWVYDSAAAANGIVYFGVFNGTVYAVNASNISILIGSYSTGGAIESSPAIGNGIVYVGSDDNKIYALNASNISYKLSEYTTGNDVISSPAIINGTVYVGSNDKKIYKFELGNFEPNVNLIITKTDTPDPVNNGSLLNYSISLTVSGNNATNVSIFETYDANVSFVNSNPIANLTNNTWYLGNLTPGTYNNIINITVLVNSSVQNGTIITNLANATYYNVTGSLLSNSTTITTTANVTVPTTIINNTNLIITKTDTPDPVNNGSLLNYSIDIAVYNSTAYNVTVIENYDANVTFVSSSPLANLTNNTWYLGNLTPGTYNNIINITVLVNSTVQNGTIITNLANATFYNATGSLISNSTTITTTANVTVPTTIINNTALIITKTDTPDPVNNGSLLNYSISLTVSGNNATNVSIFETYDANVTYVSASPPPSFGTNQWINLGDFSPGTYNNIINITVLVNSSVQNGTIITNLANATYYNVTGSLISNSTTITTTANVTVPTTIINNTALIITKTDTPDPVENGSLLNYSISLTVSGNNATNVSIFETYDANVTFVSSSPLANLTNNTWYLGNLTPGTYNNIINITVLVNSSVQNGTIITNLANATYYNVTGSLISNSTTITTTANVTAAPAVDNPPNVTLISPSNATSTTSTSINFNCNATDDINLANLTLYVWLANGSLYYNNTNITTGTSNSSTWSVSLSVDNYLWNCLAYDNASQSDWDNNYTLTITSAVTPPSGGGGGTKCTSNWVCTDWSDCNYGTQTRNCYDANACGGTGPAETRDCQEEEQEPQEEVEEDGTLPDDRISEIRGTTGYNVGGIKGAITFGTTNFSINFTNFGDKPIENVTIIVEEPALKKEAQILHPRKIFGWDILNMIGWIIKGNVKELRLLEWYISEPKHYAEIKPGESITADFGTNVPLMKYDYVELKFKILSYDSIIYEGLIPVQINTTQFLVIADTHEEDNLVDLYMIISNKEPEDKIYHVEVDINSAADPDYMPTSSVAGLFQSIFEGPKTLVAEYYGPYKIKTNESILFAYQYEYSNKFAGEYYIKYSLYDGDTRIKTASGDLNLKRNK